MDAVAAEFLKNGILGAIIVALGWWLWRREKRITAQESLIVALKDDCAKEIKEKNDKHAEEINTLHEARLADAQKAYGAALENQAKILTGLSTASAAMSATAEATKEVLDELRIRPGKTR